MHSRRKMLLLHGLPEEPNEDIVSTLAKTISERLKITEFYNKDINRCHRIGKTTSTDRSRPVLEKFNDEEERNRIWFSKAILKGSGLAISEFLTPLWLLDKNMGSTSASLD
ncbi:unnamed protein product [Diatraea saccharalis]|uniref:Uncharacterized protein n=1 Tax=Diatraea saccharalis TaxID=40085 RepID=A0A9N9R7U5_9NEOP|nr:unnamed protein product [Diatraea saccharalis]